MTKKKGFTLIELLIVIAIIGVLASIVLVSMGGARSKARDAVRQSDVRQIASAMELNYGDLEKYLTSSGMPTEIGTYMASVPKDPKTKVAYLDAYWFNNLVPLNDQKYCFHVPMENVGGCTVGTTPTRYFTASHKGTAELCADVAKVWTIDCN